MFHPPISVYLLLLILWTPFTLLELMLVSPDPGLYSFINQGALTVDGIDDVEEMKITDVCIVSME